MISTLLYGTLTTAASHCGDINTGVSIRFIRDGCVKLNGKQCIKPDQIVKEGDVIEIKWNHLRVDRMIITANWLERHGTR